MHIEFKDDYNETTYYFGTVKFPESTRHGEYDFHVEVVYFSTQGNWTISAIEWNEYDFTPEEKAKAEERITKIVMDWHGKKGDINMVIELEDPKNRRKNDN